MKINSNQQGRKGSLSGLVIVALLCISALLFASSFRAAPNKSQQEAQLIQAPTRATSTRAAAAITLTVTTTNDSGPGSFRQALADAHDGDTIQFDPSLNGQTITLTSAELVIDKSITISGPGPGLLRLSGNHQTANFRMIHLMPNHTVAISGLTINGGQLVSENGAGILSDHASLTITNCAISGNGTSAWSGVFAGGAGIYNNGTLSLINSTVSGNGADGGWSSGGGGISNANPGTLTITQSSISGNSSHVVAGGIANSGMLTISSSTVSNNRTDGLGHTSGNGGGISNGGTLIIQNSTVSGNTAAGEGGQGGGITNSGSLEVTNSTISGNTAMRGGGIYGGGRVTNSTISGNSVFFDGGGISGTGIVSNSTISDNLANHSGGGIYGGGTITNSTISSNTANSNQGGGIYVTNQIALGNTILKAGTSGANIFNNGTVISHGYNISSDNGGGFLTGLGDQINTDPILGPLQNNGGPTFTHALLNGSAAINAGDPTFTPPPSTDQRGYPRVYNGRIDIGSFEIQPIPTPSPTPTPSATPTPTPTPTPCLPVITQSSSQAITTANSASCNNGMTHTDNSYWRAFDMNAFASGGQYCINSVSFGVEFANITQPVTVRLYTTSNFPTGFPGSLTQIGATTINVGSAQNGTVVTTPLVATVPAGTPQLVMELFTPDGQAGGYRFFVGSNAASELDQSYWSAPACGFNTPLTTAAIGFPNMHIVLDVNGTCSCLVSTSPTPTPTLTPSPTPPCSPVISHSTSQAITTPAPACANPPPMTFQYDNHYWRAFNMQNFVGGAQYTVSSVSFGVKFGSGGLPSSTVIVRLYANNGAPFPAATGTQIGTNRLTVTPEQAGTVVTTPLVATVPAGTNELVMELYVLPSGNFLFAGANVAPETGPSYWSSIDFPGCSSTPQVISRHLVFNVYGTCTGPTATPTPTPCPIFNVTGTVGQCTTTGPSGVALPGVTITRTSSGGDASTITDNSGFYFISGFSCVTNTLTPSKAALTPGSAGIDTVDVIAIQKHFLIIGSPLTGCRLTAANVNSDSNVNTVDVIATQKFFLGQTSGTANVGTYSFTPPSRSYSPPINDQTAQNYDAIVFGDVASPFTAP